MRDKYFQFVKTNENVTELYVYGDIRKPDFIEQWLGINDETRVDAYTFKDAIKDVDTPNLLVRINSPGGSVAEALAIYSLLSDFKGNLITKIDGMACSAASVIFMAGKERIMTASSLLMIHNAWTEASGDSNELRKAADDLEMITQPSVNIYQEKTNLSEEEIKEMMNVETWMDYNIAFEKGFATSIEKDNDAQQSVRDINKYIRNLVSENIKLKKELEDHQEPKEIHEDKNMQTGWDAFF